MAKSELVAAIREDFLASRGPSETFTLDTFCDFAVAWLDKKGVQGVGMQDAGLALRFADGSQLGLIVPDVQPTTADTPAVGINAAHREDPRRILGDSPSVGITGN